MRVLVVDDNASKRAAVRRTLLEVDGVRDGEIVDATDVRGARLLLSQQQYDLLVLDIALPNYSGGEVDRSAGSDLFEDLTNRPDGMIVPGHVVGLTEYPDIYAGLSRTLQGALLTIAEYRPDSTAWQEVLRARAKHVALALSTSERPVEPKSDLGIVCALHNPELMAVIRHVPWSWEQKAAPGDGSLYWRGLFADGRRDEVVYLTACPRPGMPAAAVQACKIISTYRPRFLAMCGITAGLRRRVKLGDVVVTDPSWDWGSGKWTMLEAKPQFQPAPHQIGLSTWMRERLRVIGTDEELLRQIWDLWEGPKPEAPPTLHLGPSASGDAVLADGKTIERVIEQHRGLLGIEMEVYGVFEAASEAATPRPQAFALKSVVDFADAMKGDETQAYAAYVSASILRHFAERFLFVPASS